MSSSCSSRSHSSDGSSSAYSAKWCHVRYWLNHPKSKLLSSSAAADATVAVASGSASASGPARPGMTFCSYSSSISSCCSGTSVSASSCSGPSSSCSTTGSGFGAGGCCSSALAPHGCGRRWTSSTVGSARLHSTCFLTGHPLELLQR